MIFQPKDQLVALKAKEAVLNDTHVSLNHIPIDNMIKGLQPDVTNEVVYGRYGHQLSPVRNQNLEVNPLPKANSTEIPQKMIHSKFRNQIKARKSPKKNEHR